MYSYSSACTPFLLNMNSGGALCFSPRVGSGQSGKYLSVLTIHGLHRGSGKAKGGALSGSLRRAAVSGRVVSQLCRRSAIGGCNSSSPIWQEENHAVSLTVPSEG